jgi:hypothetical protein
LVALLLNADVEEVTPFPTVAHWMKRACGRWVREIVGRALLVFGMKTLLP